MQFICFFMFVLCICFCLCFFFKDKQITKQNHWAYNTERREIKKKHNITQKIKNMSNTNPTYNRGFTNLSADINKTLNGHYVGKF